MKETGIVTEVKGEIAVVKVERLVTSGGGCCVASSVEPFFLETQNLCHARAGDKVRVESDYDRIRFRNLAQAGICIAVFIIGLGTGEAVLPRLGISAYNMPLSFALGIILAAIALGIIRRFNKGNPQRFPMACEMAQP